MKRLALLFLAGCTAGELHYREPPTVLGAGRFTMTIDGLAGTVVLARDGAPLATLDARSFQLGTAAADPDASWDPAELEGSATVTYHTPGAWDVSYDATIGQARIDLDYGGGLRAYVALAAASTARFTLNLVPVAGEPVLGRIVVRTPGGDAFYGTGASPGRVEQSGTFHAMQANAGGDPHAPIPLVVSTRGWGMVAVSDRVGAIDVARREPNAVEATYAVTPIYGMTTDALRVDVLAGDGPLDVYAQYGGATKPPAAPPTWSLAPWLWRGAATQASLEADAKRIRDLDLAIGNLGTTVPVSTGAGTFDFVAQSYPDPAALVASLKGLGFHAGLESAPYSTQPAAAQYLAKTGAAVGANGPPIDFTTTAAGAYWAGLVQRYAGAGLDAIWLDGGEDVVPSLHGRRTGWSFASGVDERTMHARYPRDLHGVYTDAVEGQDPTQPRLADPKPPTLFVPATRAGDGGIVLQLPGTIGSFADLSSALASRISLSASGVPFTAAEVETSDPDLLARGIEASALFPILALAAPAGTDPFGVLPDVLRTYLRLHLRLYPFFATEAAHVADRPIVRPLAYVDPAVTSSDAFAVGDDLLVAPVITALAGTRSVTFPKGTWYGWNDGAAYAGTADVAAARDVLPLFLREGAIVPMLRPTIDTLAPAAGYESFADHPGVLHAEIAPGPARELVVFDGARIARTAAGTLEVADGSTFREGFVLELLATPRPTTVLRNGAPLEGWTWTADRGGALVIPLPAGSATVTLQ